MKKLTRICVMLTALLALSAIPALAQQGKAANAMDFGLAYTYKWAKASTTNGPEFGLSGGAVDAAYTPGKYKGLGLAADVSGETAQGIEPGINLSQVSFVAGPRYTLTGPVASFYVESLFGMVHGFNSVFPSGTAAVQPSANGFASQYGGGLNFMFSKHLGWRAAEVDWIYTRLPNNTNTYQSDIRFSTGLTFHF